MKKKRIALITNGSIGVGFMSEGVPHHVQFIDKIAQIYDLTVYSCVKINEGFLPTNYQIIDVPFQNNQSLTLRVLILIFRLLKNHILNSYDIFHGFWGFPSGFLAVLMGKFFQLPSIVSFLGGEVVYLPEINYGEFHKTWFQKIIYFTAKNAGAIIALSDYQISKIKLSGVQIKRMERIPFGIDLSLFKFVEKPLKTPFQLLHVADINLVKDQETLLRTLQKISLQVDSHLTMVGRDTLNGKIQRLAEKLGLSEKITFLGGVSYQNLPETFAKAHVFLLTSLSEAQAVVVNEAMASGLVVVGTRVGLIADLENDCTLAVDIKDVDDLAEKVIDLFKNPQKYAELQANGLAWTRKYDLDWTVGKYQELYEDLFTAKKQSKKGTIEVG